MYFRMVDESVKQLVFPEAFYLATKGGGAFFGNVGSFEEGYEFDVVVLDDSVLPSPQTLTLAERMERAVYLSLDSKKITAKYVSKKYYAKKMNYEIKKKRWNFAHIKCYYFGSSCNLCICWCKSLWT